MEDQSENIVGSVLNQEDITVDHSKLRSSASNFDDYGKSTAHHGIDDSSKQDTGEYATTCHLGQNLNRQLGFDLVVMPPPSYDSVAKYISPNLRHATSGYQELNKQEDSDVGIDIDDSGQHTQVSAVTFEENYCTTKKKKEVAGGMCGLVVGGVAFIVIYFLCWSQLRGIRFDTD